ncbi:UNVERIFIED_CONTAM: putative RNA-dependent RNA polymerase 3 [Sesamum latifolium]|uniref:RNA-dependent RNA polymerase n=1 Tax=Sesamum latifolium TaxID=2727402 RepID=A0AAW2VDH6_9LAMI
MDASSPDQEVRLPESVEMIIQRICLEKNQPPLKKYARDMLALIGEQAALKVLTTVLFSKTLRSFGGYVSFLVKKDFPDQADAVLSAYDSLQSSASPNKSQYCERLRSPVSSFSVDTTPSNLNNTGPQNIRCSLSFEDETLEKRSPGARRQSPLPDELREMTDSVTISQQLMILSKLQFRKLFLVLSYIGRQKLEAVVNLDSANEIYSMKNLPMKDFEAKIWNSYGKKFCEESDRSQYLDWDSQKTHHYYCHVCRDGSYYFKGPYLNSFRTHLQRSLGDDNILIVKFLEDDSNTMGTSVVEEGILVGLRRYRFFVFKDERKKVKKIQMVEKKSSYSAVKGYYVHVDSVSPQGYEEGYILSRKTISEARRLFMHIHTVSTIEKYMARFSLILSKTRKLDIDFKAVTIQRIEDIPFRDENNSIIHDEDGKPILHTDGTGYISEDLAMKCPRNFSLANDITDYSFEKYEEIVNNIEDTACQKRGAEARNKEPPLLIQCRLFYDGCAVKGTLLINRKLEPGTIQIRPSMIKVERDQKLPLEEIFKSLEIVATSRRPGRNAFSKYLIALLSYGGVPQEFFLNLLTNALEETRNVYSDTRAALRVASNYDALEVGLVARRMISSGIPLSEPYLQHCLSSLETGEKIKLKQGKIPVSESFYLMGTADPTGLLKNHEVCVILDNGQISGKVLVYRNPGMHFGDVHVMEAVYKEELEEVVGNAKYGIFFSTKGKRSAAYEMATGDFDGDMYWVSRNPELLKYFKASEPWKRLYSTPADSKTRNPREFSDMDLERELFQLFQEARKPSFSMATAADSWLAFMDRLLTLGDDRASEKHSLKKKIIQLIDIYYDALDAPKSGKKVKVPKELQADLYPHHMERGAEFSYDSSSILGQIYDTVNAFKNEAVPRKEIWKLPCLVDPIPELYLKWKARYKDYREEMTSAMKSSDESKDLATRDIIHKYKQLLYEAPCMEESAKNTEEIYEEAIAIYHVVYDYAMRHGVTRCSFAWKVAGSALCDLCAWKLAGPKEEPIAILPSVLRELLK